MKTLDVARAAAVALSLGTFAFLFLADSWRADNPFLIPDLILCVALLVAAALPAAEARPVLLFTFGLTAGVLGCAAATDAVAGRLSVGSLAGVVGATVMAVVLGRAWQRIRV